MSTKDDSFLLQWTLYVVTLRCVIGNKELLEGGLFIGTHSPNQSIIYFKKLHGLIFQYTKKI